MQVKVYAKLNLTLNVLGKKNGFHIIDSVAASVDIYDTVEVTPRGDNRVVVSGTAQISMRQNTAYKAACAFIERFGSSSSDAESCLSQPVGVDIAIKKGIPMGAGMGGSSADAAAVIYALCKLRDIDVDSQAVRNLCAELGSDINFMLHGGLARLRGKGDDVDYCKAGNTLYFALTTFDTSMSASEVYSQFDILGAEQVYVDNAAIIKILNTCRSSGVAECFNNHLQAAVVSLSDYANEYLQFCDKNGLAFNMTGSGSAYYVAFNNEQSACNACDLLNSHGFQTVVCRSVSCGIEII